MKIIVELPPVLARLDDHVLHAVAASHAGNPIKLSPLVDAVRKAISPADLAEVAQMHPKRWRSYDGPLERDQLLYRAVGMSTQRLKTIGRLKLVLGTGGGWTISVTPT